MRTIIGLAALARSGKDTAASMLLAHQGVAAFALADPLKVGCQALFGLTDDETWLDTQKEKTIELWGRSPREFFQTVGTEWMRNHNADHWLMRAAREINPPSSQVSETSTSSPSKPLAPGAPDAPFSLAAQAFFDFADEQMIGDAYDTLDAYWGLSPAQAVSLLKTLTLRMYPDFEERRVIRRLEPLKRREQVPMTAHTIVIKDIRFENEAAFLRAHNGQIWHIKRPDLQAVKAHSSELGIEQASADVLIVNDGSLEVLRTRIEHAWAQQQHKNQNINNNKN
ncbi:hypothetical protein M2262_003157 [Pseudomonas sp. BIGb0408]|uniref:Deoxynucleotide monophosphate kinase n=1 Tax=Phytopseudomonas flavescens TaxID=29435 RepID=A0A7Z0BPP7_9GAMM|nr:MULTISPECIES: deoxynucleotide monophosphate kinase [Pseudomonas]MCW2293107.1 hypothetical protein [Pseudomonas sp. BIGb0408]NYH72323.1 hypothetical protein [Pseudomonas flavescens]